MSDIETTSFSILVPANGRVVIPAAARAALGVTGGGKLVARLVDGALVIEPVEVAVRRAQALIARYVPAGTNLADELIAERRHADD